MAIIAVASGKGGTGKTCVTSSLVKAAKNITAVDADVEEPDLSILLGMDPQVISKVTIPVPYFDEDKCIKCGKCAEACKFNAIVQFGDILPSVMSDICHGCGVCSHVCPKGAIGEKANQIGIVSEATDGGLTLIEGRLKVGAPNPVPIIKKAIDIASEIGKDVIIDSPPGTACSMVEAVGGADFALLVTEPTPFGVADLGLALEVVKDLKVPSGVIVNRCDLGDGDIDGLCSSYNVPIMARIPFSKKTAQIYSEGKSPYDENSTWKETIDLLWRKISEEVL